MIELISRRISGFKSSVSYSASRSRASLRAAGLGKKKPWQGVGLDQDYHGDYQNYRGDQQQIVIVMFELLSW